VDIGLAGPLGHDDEVVGAKACQRATRTSVVIALPYAARRPQAKRRDNQCQTSRSRFDPSGGGLRCPEALMDYLNGLPPALRSGLDGALAVADPVFGAKAALTNLGPPSRCGCLDPYWSGRASGQSCSTARRQGVRLGIGFN
jgi:hypothetical protein